MTGTHKVPLALLRHTESPRLAGLNDEHLHLLTQTDTAFPPILVHRNTMRALDGVCRLHAAMLRGQKTVDAVFFHGPLSGVSPLRSGPTFPTDSH
ncbi:hypothetical protein [Micromonospora sp. LOL_021]|uniref:hypothetical protein n=1 Tax=Micromonospora sp. LOL_021 TaxID=3345417 RepID=UPI003A885A2B